MEMHQLTYYFCHFRRFASCNYHVMLSRLGDTFCAVHDILSRG